MKKIRLLFVVLTSFTILFSQVGMASAGYWARQVDAYGSYGSIVDRTDPDFNAINNWLNAQPSPWPSVDRYKGWVVDEFNSYNVFRVRFRYVMLSFDPNSTSNWVGDAYCTPGVYYQRVYELQRALWYLGYNPEWNQDGKWGSTTKTAVKNYQAARGLTSDGIVGTATWRNLSVAAQ